VEIAKGASPTAHLRTRWYRISADCRPPDKIGDAAAAPNATKL
jgi:hypothetical protein